GMVGCDAGDAAHHFDRWRRPDTASAPPPQSGTGAWPVLPRPPNASLRPRGPSAAREHTAEAGGDTRRRDGLDRVRVAWTLPSRVPGPAARGPRPAARPRHSAAG